MNRFCKIALVVCALTICATAALVHNGFQLGFQLRRPAARPSELYDVVWRQLAAFRRADFPDAYQHSSSTFQEKFSVDAFSDLIRTDYPDLLHAERLEFGNVQFATDHAMVQVFFVLGNGDVVPCIYSLIRQGDGWKIDGARLQKRWQDNRRLGGLRA